MGDMGMKLVALMPAIVFVLIALFEMIRPRRGLRFGRFLAGRQLSFGGAVRLAAGWVFASPAPVGPEHNNPWFNQIALPLWAEWFGAFLLLDFAMWLQHLLTHKVPLLWRFHKVHHADPDIDVSTAIASTECFVGAGYLLGVAAPIAFSGANAASGNIDCRARPVRPFSCHPPPPPRAWLP
ncbi:MAG: sterol desaturase family protein [Sphingomonadales bacterium]|nr:sterol desaturase family protein [Sphingomonadales bacterium]